MPVTALLGCAHIHTPNFVKKLAERADATVAAIWDPDPARARPHAETLGCAVVGSPEEALAAEGVEGAIICSVTRQHETLVMASVVAGKHLFVEKPLGLGREDAERMAAAIEKAGLVFQTGYFNRGTPAHQFIRAEIAAGHFGTVTRAHHSNCHSGALGGWFDTDWRWMADPVAAGCGGYGDLGTHSLDILMWWFGDVRRVTASLGPVTRRYGDCDESGEGLIEFASGVRAVLSAGWVDRADPVKFLVSGTEGHAVMVRNQLFYQSQHVEGADGKEPWTQLPPALPHAFDLFLDRLGGQDVPLVSPSEAAARSTVTEALYRAAKDGVWVEV